MKNGRLKIIRDAAVVVASTIGAGIFTLPYIFLKAGFLLSSFYLVVLGAIIIFAHSLYWRVLDSASGEKRLLGLARKHLGPFGFVLGIIGIVFGLVLVLVIYLILGSRFLSIFMPALGGTSALFFFWLFASTPLLFKEGRFLVLESFGSLWVAAVIVFIFLNYGVSALPNMSSITLDNLFLPFGAILFSLAGWTAIEPLYASYSNRGSRSSSWKVVLSLGTIFAATLYLMFISGIFSGTKLVTADTISGFMSGPFWPKLVLAVLGIFAIWTSYEPISLEIKNALQKDLKWAPWLVLVLVIFVPLVLVLSGFANLLRVIGLAGGVFLSLQYLLILLVARRALKLTSMEKLFSGVAILVFILGAVYEIYYFVAPTLQ